MSVKQNSLKAWLLAMRPKTLTAAAVPVIIAVAIAWKDVHTEAAPAENGSGIQWLPAVLCLLFAWIMQIDSNLVNDYFDFRHGNDDETRLGPKRACAEGWITPKVMLRGIVLTTVLGCAAGLPLIFFGGWQMIAVGIACVLFCFLYTTTFSYLGLGDLLVILFFGMVPVCCTYYLVLPAGMQGVTTEVFMMSIACGLAVDTLLLVNNYRDYDNDMKAGKKTLVIHIGRKSTEILYCLLGNVAIVCSCINAFSVTASFKVHLLLVVLVLNYMVMHNLTFLKMKRIGQGKELNSILGETARNIFLYGISTCLMYLI